MVNPRGKIPPKPRRSDMTPFQRLGHSLVALGEAMLDSDTTINELTTLARHCGLKLEFSVIQPGAVPANAVSAAEEILREAPYHFVFTDKNGVECRYIRTDNVGKD